MLNIALWWHFYFDAIVYFTFMNMIWLLQDNAGMTRKFVYIFGIVWMQLMWILWQLSGLYSSFSLSSSSAYFISDYLLTVLYFWEVFRPLCVIVNCLVLQCCRSSIWHGKTCSGNSGGFFRLNADTPFFPLLVEFSCSLDVFPPFRVESMKFRFCRIVKNCTYTQTAWNKLLLEPIGP